MENQPSNHIISLKTHNKLARKNAQLMKSHPAMRLLSSLTLPKESPAVRCGRAYGSDPTAAVKLFIKENLRYPSNNLGDLNSNSFTTFAFRNPLRSKIVSYGLSNGDSAVYQSDFSVQLTNGDSFPEHPGPMAPVAGNVMPHGVALYFGRLGKSDQHRGIICSVGNFLNFSVGANPSAIYPAGAVATLVIKFLRGAIWEPVADATFTVAGGLAPFGFTTPETGYYSFNFTVDLPLVTGAIPVTTGFVQLWLIDPATPAPGMVWAQQALPQIEELITTIDAMRVIGVSAMYTNTASPLNRQGQQTGLQVPKNILFTQVLDQADVQSLAKSTTFSIVDGMYGFLKPTAISDLEMEPFEFTTDAAGSPFVEFVFDIYPKSDYLVIATNVVDANGRQGYTTHAYSAEYETFNQWAELQVASVNSTHLDTALRALSAVPQWHTNDFHIDDIWGWIKDAAGAVWGGIKEVASVAGPLLPVAAALL